MVVNSGWCRISSIDNSSSFPLVSSPPSEYSDHGSNNRMSEAMNYQTISSKDLARLVLAEGGWSNLLKRKFSNLWIWQLFLLAEGYFCKQKCRSSSCELSQGPFTKSNFSMGFPYVAASEEAMENSLVSGFAEACGQDLGINPF
ncbi:uncharacterized protein LOC133700450 isoform X3 [Populus nigra]|uniref:uncharacterized protein LOC133700450 isoform X3 n=1 Tax=Populus nigra TaxID=3691 RepID=UPI002B2690DE|nr:uncharacterized protein LOC133700450 isoform X3 [Populus nigra]